jgi:hypothetical protein
VIELDIQSMHSSTIKGSPEQISGQAFFTKDMKRRLARKPELIDQILPSFSPACRRLTPGPGYLEALTDDKVDVIFSGIAEVDADGIRTVDGQRHPVDAIVCATGFDTTFLPRFPIIGRTGLSLSEKWKDVPETYIAVTTDDFPNYFMCLGPNSALGAGNLLVLVEKQIDYITWCVSKMQRENIRSMAPRKEAVKQFSRYCEEYFTETVFGEKCRSWYKAGRDEGRIVALWPGTLPFPMLPARETHHPNEKAPHSMRSKYFLAPAGKISSMNMSMITLSAGLETDGPLTSERRG